jgi:hypothetical protein
MSAGGLLVAVLALASCGGSGDREALERMILASMAETGPESCLKFNTLHFLEKSSDREGKAAVIACEEDALDPPLEQPTDVDVSHIETEGDSGNAVLAFSGSIFDGQRVQYAFVEREGSWKFDETMRFVDLDATHLIMQMGREGMLQAETRWDAENVACWIGRMERMSDKALEELLFGDGVESSNCIGETSAI